MQDADELGRHVRLDVLRREHPAYLDAASGCVLLSRMGDARGWLADPVQWKNPDRAEEGSVIRLFKPADMNRPGERDAGVIWMDEPDHSRVRQPLQAALAKRLGSLKSEVEAIVKTRLDALPEGGFDVVADFAAPLPIVVVARVLGLDVRNSDQLRAWSQAALSSFNPTPSANDSQTTKTAAEAVLSHFDAMLVERRSQLRDDLVSDLIIMQQQGVPISDAEIVVNCLSLMAGGIVTTADLIASAVWLLLSHPDQLRRLRADPGLMGSAVEEVLRFEPPGDVAQRVASSTFELAGCPVRARQVVAVVIPAANRDPTAFARPHEFDIARKDGPHVSFGAGPHMCIGAPLARLQTKAALAGLLARFPNLRLSPSSAAPRWRPDAYFRGLQALPVEV